MLLVAIRTIILYATTVLLLRIMGKRQIGEIQPYELVVIIMISELAAIPMENTSIPLLNGLIPIFILVAAQITLSFLSLKSERARGVICGKPSILIEKSRIMEEEMRRQRYNLNDLLEQLRLKNVSNITNVEYAILETSGQLSVILKSDKRPVEPKDLGIATTYDGLPVTLIIDGRIINENLQKIKREENWLHNELSARGVNSYKDVLIASIDAQGNLYYQLKNQH